jgi:hypothetical protein
MAYDRHDLTWKGNQLHIVGRRNPVAEIVPDSRWPKMWRYRLLPAGELSDMANLSRAKDAAAAVAIADLGRSKRRSEAA